MSPKLASKSKKVKKDVDWAFNLRTQFFTSDSDDSGSEADDQELATGNIGANRLLIDDLDLSTREENVTYKPNPFSIAKINAAHRPTSTVNDSVPRPAQQARPAHKPTQARQRNSFNIPKINAASYPSTIVKGSVLQPAQPLKPTYKPVQNQKPTKRLCTDSGQTTIMEGFKNQALKFSRTNAVPLRPIANSISHNSNPAVIKPVAEKPVVSVSPSKLTVTSLDTSAMLASPCSVSSTMIPNASQFHSTPSYVPEYAHILTPKASPNHDSQILSKISPSRDFSPAQLLPHMRKRTDNRGPVFSSFSSPGQLYDDSLHYDPHISHSQTYSSPIRHVREHPLHLHSTVAQPFRRQTTGVGFVPHFLKPFEEKRVFLQGSFCSMFSFLFTM